jgi:hypothetical protein
MKKEKLEIPEIPEDVARKNLTEAEFIIYQMLSKYFKKKNDKE